MTPILLFGIGLVLAMALSGGASAEEGTVPKIQPPKMPEPGDFPLPEGEPMSPGEGLAPLPGSGSPGSGPAASPGSGLPSGVSPGEAAARERAARAEAEARGARARAAAAEAAHQREAAGRAAAARDVAAAREAAGRAAAAQAAAAAEARAAREATARAEAARREAEGRAAAEAAARARDAQAAAERAQRDASRIAALESQVVQARGAANQKIREAQDSTAKANAAIRAANDARAAAGRARTAAEKAHTYAVAQRKQQEARVASAEAAAKRAQAAVAEAQARTQEANAALARAEKARKDALDASTVAATEKDAVKRAAAIQEMQLKEQLARAEEEKARIASTSAAKAKETAASATQAARDAAKPAPTQLMPTPKDFQPGPHQPVPGARPGETAPGPATAIETSPTVLEQKRKVIAEAFKRGVQKVMEAHQKAGKPISQQQAVSLVNATFLGKGIPTGRPNPIDPRWKKNIRQIADGAANAVNAIAVPAPRATTPTPSRPAPFPTPSGTDPASLERKRLVVSRAFTAAIAKAQKVNPKLSRQQAINAAASHFTAQKIPLTKPSPSAAFWKQDEKAIAGRVANAVNIFSPPPSAPSGSRPTPVTPSPAQSKPSVTMDVEQQKLKLAGGAYANAVEYTIQAFKQRQGKVLTAPQALRIIMTDFQNASLTRVGGSRVPPPYDLQAPSPYFMSQSVAQIASAMKRSFEAAKNTADFFSTMKAASPGDAGATPVKDPWSGKNIFVIKMPASPIKWNPPVPDAPPGHVQVSGVAFHQTPPLKGGLITFGWAA